MITLTARINLINSNSEGRFDNAEAWTPPINISNVSYETAGNVPIGNPAIVGNPFLIGLSKLGGGDTYSGNVNYYIGSEFSDEYGHFEIEQIIYLEDFFETVSAFTICFDKQNGRFPHSIKVDGVTYTDDDANYSITITPDARHYIKINDWNTPYYPVVISGIFVDLSIELDYNQITGVSREIRERSDVSAPSFGVLSNGGELEFSDFDGEFLDYVEQNILKSGVEVIVKLNNTISGMSKQIAKLYVDDVSYDVDNKVVSLSLKDGIEKLQNLFNVGFSCNPEYYSGKTFLSIYQSIKEGVEENGIPVQDISDLDNDTVELLSENYLKIPLTSAGKSVWSILQEFGEATMAHFYVGNDGELKYKAKEV